MTFRQKAVRVGVTTFVAAATALAVFGNYQIDSNNISKTARQANTAQIAMSDISRTRAHKFLSAASYLDDCLSEAKKGPQFIGNTPLLPVLTKSICEYNFKSLCDDVVTGELSATKELESANNALLNEKTGRNTELGIFSMTAFLVTLATWSMFPWGFRRPKKQDALDSSAKPDVASA